MGHFAQQDGNRQNQREFDHIFIQQKCSISLKKNKKIKMFKLDFLIRFVYQLVICLIIETENSDLICDLHRI